MLHLSNNGINTVNAAVGLFNRKSLRTFEKKGQEPSVYLSDHIVRDVTSASQEVTCDWSGPHQNSNIVAHLKYCCTANINLEIIWTAAIGLFYRKSLRTFKKKGTLSLSTGPHGAWCHFRSQKSHMLLVWPSSDCACRTSEGCEEDLWLKRSLARSEILNIIIEWRHEDSAKMIMFSIN